MTTATLPAAARAAQVSKGPNLLLIRIVFAIGLLSLWQGVVWMRFVPPYLFPGPVAVFQSLVEMSRDGTLALAVRSSLARMLIGYTISVIGGLILGVIAAQSLVFRKTFGSIILSLQSLPSICWLPLALIWFGLNEKSIIVVIVLGAMFSIAIATENAVRNVPPIYRRVGAVLGAKGYVFARDVLFFAALPELLSGFRLGWSFGWRSLMAAELIRTDVTGVGTLLETGRQFNDTSVMFASMLVILAIGLIVDWLIFRQLETRLRSRWGLETTR